MLANRAASAALFFLAAMLAPRAQFQRPKESFVSFW
jgi:hypothetical protein